MYYKINEEAAKRANDANRFCEYQQGSATANYHRMVDKAVEIAENQKKRVDSMYHDKIDWLLDTYCRNLPECMAMADSGGEIPQEKCVGCMMRWLKEEATAERLEEREE